MRFNRLIRRTLQSEFREKTTRLHPTEIQSLGSCPKRKECVPIRNYQPDGLRAPAEIIWVWRQSRIGFTYRRPGVLGYFKRRLPEFYFFLIFGLRIGHV